MDGPRNFFYDDYMGSNLHGQEAVDNFGPGGQTDSFCRHADFRSAIDMPLDSYTTSRRTIPSRSRFFDDFPTRKPVHVRRIPARHQASRYDDYPAPRRGVGRMIRDDDEPVEEIVRVIRKPRFQKARTVTVVRKIIVQRVRKPGGERRIAKAFFENKGRPGPSKDRAAPFPRRVSSGGIQKRKDRKEYKHKPSRAQLDAELDAYMRSSKHPRVALVELGQNNKNAKPSKAQLDAELEEYMKSSKNPRG